MEELPVLESQKELFSSRNTLVVAFNVDEMPKDRVIKILEQTYLRSNSASYPFVFSKSKEEMVSVRNSYKALNTPTSYLLDPKGTVVFSHVGILHPQDLKAALDKLPAD